MVVQRLKKNPLALLALIVAAFYPVWLGLFSYSVRRFLEGSEMSELLVPFFGAILPISIIFSIPVAAYRSLRKSNSALPTQVELNMKRFLHLVFATPPFYVLFYLIISRLGWSGSQNVAWYVVFLFAVVYFIVATNDKQVANAETSLPKAWRVVHGIAASVLLAVFLSVHLFNHVLAIWSDELHIGFMNGVRQWYTHPVVEPVFLLAISILIVTGIRMVWHYSRNKVDSFRTLQTLSGFYLSLFFGAHLLAVFSARVNGRTTDWYFATGDAGLLKGAVMLIPYYSLATLLVIIHANLGLRLLLIDRGKAESMANRFFYMLTLIGGVASAAITIATLGFSIE